MRIRVVTDSDWNTFAAMGLFAHFWASRHLTLRGPETGHPKKAHCDLSAGLVADERCLLSASNIYAAAIHPYIPPTSHTNDTNLFLPLVQRIQKFRLRARKIKSRSSSAYVVALSLSSASAAATALNVLLGKWDRSTVLTHVTSTAAGFSQRMSKNLQRW